jgi:uncharacterized membrane protein YfcA
MMEYLGYSLALLTGASLGLVGSGGSILTLPILVYLFRIAPVMGTAYSLFIVGVTSLAGLADQARKGRVDWRVTAVFAAPSLLGVFLVRRYVIHALPDVLHLPMGFVAGRDSFIMALFALMMAAAGAAMLLDGRKRAGAAAPDPGTAPAGKAAPGEGPGPRLNFPAIALEGLFVGVATGFVGAGGGFLIVPALVLLAGLPLETAIGTSLAVIAVKSLAGFAGDVGRMGQMDWAFLGAFSLLSLIGVAAGGYAGRRLSGNRLKRGFGICTVVLAVAILCTEVLS